MRSPSAGWYRIANTAVDGATRIDIYDEIGYWGVMAADFAADLRKVRGDLDLHINSPGGDVFDGLTIYNALLQHRGDVAVSIDGLAASAASFIAQAARKGKLKIAKTATMMIHNGMGMVIGDASDMRKMAEVLDEQTQNIAGIYADRTGKPVEYWLGLMNAETWLLGQKAVDCGLADALIEVDAQPVNQWDLSVFKNTPPHLADGVLQGTNGRIRNSDLSTIQEHNSTTGRHEHVHPAYDSEGNIHSHVHAHHEDSKHGHDHGVEWQSTDGEAGPRDFSQLDADGVTADGDTSIPANAASVPYVSPHETRHIPMTGRHAHDHGSHGHASHDDGIHSHSHNHSNSASHDHHGASNGDGDQDDGGGMTSRDGTDWTDVLPSWLTQTGNVPVANASYDDSDWDGDAAMAAAGAADDPAAAFKAICAGRRAGPADERGSYALPHHKKPGAAANRHGVNNALARFSSTNGLTNSSEAKAHLEAHQKTWSSESSDGDTSSNTAGDTWQDAATRVGVEMATLLSGGPRPVADAPQGGE